MAERVAFFNATVVVDYDDAESTAWEAFQGWAADNDLTDAFALTSIEPKEPEAITYYATSEHDRDDLLWPLPADAWFWQTGNRWVAVYSEFHPDWWEGTDPEDIAARPTPWRRPITDVPSTGTLVYNDANGVLNTTERGVQ